MVTRKPPTTSATRAEAEAAAWLARLQGPHRTAASEAAFKAWLQADPANERAFEHASAIWDLLPGAAAAGAEPAIVFGAAVPPRQTRRRALQAMAAAVAGLLCLTGGYAWLQRDPTYSTDVGQQTVTLLEDGTRVALNTDSKLVVDYSDKERHVRLLRGEALFEVTKDARRPFIVSAGAEQVRALGTSFLVRRHADSVDVTLLEGKVEVTRTEEVLPAPVKIAVLAPGERLRVRPAAGASLDRPNLEAVTAWRRGDAIFDDVPLIDAVAELNRYGRTQVIVGDPSLADLRVSGIFATRDVVEFARAMAVLHDLRIEHDGDSIVLRRKSEDDISL